MKRGTKEYYEILDQFEKEMADMIYGHKVERYTREESENIPASEFYKNGFVNQLCQVYMRGYAHAKAVYQD
jgi:NAD dependent epimerase/dehydratase family enzyme